MLRFILKQKLKYLSSLALKKHQMELIVVTGWYDTRIVKDMTYTLLHPKYNVRTSVSEPWWDLSVPLTILGYKDKKRSTISWMILLFRAYFRLILGKSNPQGLILNLNYSKEDTAKFWSSFVKPNILVVTHYNKDMKILSKLIDNTKKKKGTIIFNSKDYKEMMKLIGKYNDIFIYGKDSEDISYDDSKENLLILKRKDQKYEIQTQFLPIIKAESIVASLSVAIVKGVPLVEALYSLLKFEMPLRLVKNIKGILN